jgi:hypothetical protein
MFRTLRFVYLWSLVACVLLLATAIPAAAQETQNFHYVIPRFSSSAGSEIIISNLSARLVTAEVTLLDAKGSVSSIIPFGAGTLGRLTAASFALSSFDGSVAIDSSAPLSVLATLSAKGGFETVEPATRSGTLIVPFGPGTSGIMQLTIFNEEPTSTAVVISAVASDGTSIGAVQRVIPSLGTQTEDVRGMFPQTGFGSPRDISHLVLRTASNVFGSARQVYAQAEMINFIDRAEGLVVPTDDFSAVNAVPVSSATLTGLVPFFAQGGGYVTLLQLINTSNAAGSVTVTARGTDGNAITGAVVLSLPANGSIRRSVQNIFGLPEGLRIGSVSFESSVPVVATEAIASATRGAFTLIPSGPASSTNFAFSVHDFNGLLFTGFSFLNPGPSPARLVLRSLSDEGIGVSRTTLTVNPFSSVLRTLSELLPEVRNKSFIHVSSDVPIIATGIEGALDNTLLGHIPAMHSQPDFVAADPSRFQITGTVRHNGVPFAGVIIQLSGPLNVATSTDANGVYFFQDTPAGLYTIRPGATGYSFDPPARTATLSSDTSRDNDFAATLITPVVTAVFPPSVAAGSPDTVISVVATPITSTSEIVFEGTPVFTTIGTAALPVTVSGATGGTVTVVQNVTALKATISAARLAVAHTGSFVVRTHGPGGSVSSATVTFVVGNPAPVITSMSGVPDPLLIGNPGFTLVVNGTGFTSTTTLQVNGVALATTFVSPTQLRAFVPPQLLGQGGVLRVTALNPSPTVGPSNALEVSLFNPIPGVLSITPNFTEVRLDPNSLPLQMTVRGFGFSAAAVALIDGVEVPTVVRNSIELVASIPQKVLETARIAVVQVRNPPPTLGTSEAQAISIFNLVPTVTSVEASPLFWDPIPRFVGDPQTYPGQIIIRGTNFVRAEDGLKFLFSTPCDDKAGGLTGDRVSSTLIIGRIQIGCAGTYRLGATNPQPGGGVGNLLAFTVATYAAPAAHSVSGLAPAAIVAGSGTFTLTITGSGFAAGAVVNFGTAVLFPTSVTFNAIQVTVPSYLVTSFGVIPVSVTNPDVTGNSNRLLFTVN